MRGIQHLRRLFGVATTVVLKDIAHYLAPDHPMN
jgi:hypothetical protein